MFDNSPIVVYNKMKNDKKILMCLQLLFQGSKYKVSVANSNIKDVLPQKTQ